MSTLSPRQQEILEMVNKKGNLLITDIQQKLDISQATVYREVQMLIQLGVVEKTTGGIRRVELSATKCLQCGSDINPRLVFVIEKKDGTQLQACCAHCGLMALFNSSEVSTAMASDFIYGTMVNVRQAWFVLHDDIGVCCNPSVLSFSKQQDAKRFVKGFGGNAVDFNDAQELVKQKMKF